MKYVKLIISVPINYADAVRQALGEAGAGKIGNYSFTSFSTRGIGRFKPEPEAKPTIGAIGKLESVEEERIETVCNLNQVESIIDAVKKVHPYEEIAIDVYQLLFDPSKISKNTYRKNSQ